MGHETGYAMFVICALPRGDGVGAANVEQCSCLPIGQILRLNFLQDLELEV